MTPEIRLIALDLDGTLHVHRSGVSPVNQAALLAARKAGIEIVLATGKTRGSALNIIEQLGLTSPGIFVQGLVTHNGDGSIRHQQYLDRDLGREVVGLVDEDISLIAYSGTDTWVTRYDRNIELLSWAGEPRPKLCDSLAEMTRHVPINKFAAMDVMNPDKMNALRARLEEALGDRAQVLQPGLTIMVEVLPTGTSKGDALGALIEDMGIAPKHVLACGDGENDIEMLELAGIGVAMGNADENVQAAADFVSLPYDQDGVAHALSHFIPHIVPPGLLQDGDG
ncbi:MAG: HAD family hydrolase [Anaerolineaceae bacterium]|nr:HAD family hydrolase [Anaerolineaceae bacterium]